MPEFDGRGKDVKYWYWHIRNTFDLDLTSRRYEEFPKLESSESQIRFHLETLRILGASLEMKAERVKSNERAHEYRNCGNDLFLSKVDTTEVAEMYTKSIAYALPGSRELALAYANRSAVSFQAENYEECLLDIERSLEIDYPDEMKAKLFARRVRCLVTLKKSQTEIDTALQDTREAFLKMDLRANGRNLVEKTLNEENHMAPTLSIKKKYSVLQPPAIKDDSCEILGATGIKIEYSEKYGRHIVATRDIRVGEIIAVMDAYANARTFEKCYRECAHCTKETTAGIPCDHCVNVIYCSSSCRDKAWRDYHDTECPILGILLDLDVPTDTILGMRITLKALKEAGGIVELEKMLEEIDSVVDPRVRGFTNNVLDCTKYASFCTLPSQAKKRHSDVDYYISLISTFTTYYLATRTEIFGQKYNTDLQIFDENPLLVVLGKLMIRNCSIANMTGLRGGDGEDDVMVAPFTALCNHSCDSNVTFLGNNKCIAFALKPIKAGEQVWDNYLGKDYSSLTRAERQKLLEKHYHFTCDCVPCIEDWPVYEKLPEAAEMQGLSPGTRESLLDAERAFLDKANLAKISGNMLDFKDELIHLLEFLYEHACPSQRLVMCQEWLTFMYREVLDQF